MNGNSTITAYVMAIVIAGLFLLISAIIANAIKFEGGANPKDPGKRKQWFWILAILAPAVNFLIGFLVIAHGIKNPMFKEQFMIALGIGSAICLLVYIVIGFVISKINKHGKLGNWF